MQNPSEYKLVYWKIGQKPAEFPLHFGETVIGRSRECDLVLEDIKISRKHARINLFHEGQIMLTDLGSANGTQVDGKPLKPRRLTEISSLQQIVMGMFEMQIVPIREQSGPEKTPETIGDISEHATQADLEIDSAEFDEKQTGIIETPIARTPPLQQKPNFRLSIKQINQPPKEVSLNTGSWQIGREPGCTIQLTDVKVSRKHALLTLSGDKATLLDQNSSNGVWINAKRIIPNQPYAVNPGDQIKIGEHELSLHIAHQPAAAPVPVPVPISAKPSLDAAPQKPLDISVNKPLNLMGMEKVTIGRADDNDIVINHPMISRYHAIIERMGSRFRVNDLRSVNGVFVNNEKVDDLAWLKENDKIKIGPYSFHFSGTMLQQSTAEGYTIDVVDLKKWVTKTLNLLKEINFHIGQNEFIALVGMSGAGKSTLMDAINGYRPATDGRVYVNNIDMYKNYDMFRNDIGYVPQRDIVHTELTPYTCLEYCAKLRMPADTTIEEREFAIEQTLDDLGLMERKDVPISRLSGGQLKRVSIGVELLTRPKLFFLDEPTSGLDPGTEYEMMKLMRRLADQGRTIMLITHATKNVMLCDKVIIIAKGGNLAFFGAPEDALEFFDKFRTARDRLEKDMEFDDIYRILEDPDKGTPEEWARRYEEYRSKSKAKLRAQIKPRAAKSKRSSARGQKRRVSALRQFLILSSRNTRILYQDKLTMIMWLALGPINGLFNFVWGNTLFDPVDGSINKTISMWFMVGMMALLTGSMSSVREIVKELAIYKRERAVGLKIMPYILSKLWIGAALSIYSSVTMLFFLVILVKPTMPNNIAYLSMFITLTLAIFSGYLLGLLISAIVPNQNSAMIMLIAIIIPQLLFTGVMIPLENIPLGKEISVFMSARWALEGFVKTTGVGDTLIEDNCWELPKDERNDLSDDEKVACLCMGENIFIHCDTIPGILSDDFYDDDAQIALAQNEPVKPLEPTAISSPTPIPSPTPMPSPTAFPTPTKLPMQQDMDAYMEDASQQQSDYIDARMEQLEDYQHEVEDEINVWADLQTEQMEDFGDASKQQYEDYADYMEIYGDDLAVWKNDRMAAIGAAESILAVVYDDYGDSFRGTVFARWIYVSLICLGIFVLLIFFQKRKDVV